MIRVACNSAIDIGHPTGGAVRCRLALFGGRPHAGVCANCEMRNSADALAVRGLGDLVAKVAKPIAKAIGKDPNCPGCKKRQEKLNALVPL
jgi:hypothetical protein